MQSQICKFGIRAVAYFVDNILLAALSFAWWYLAEILFKHFPVTETTTLLGGQVSLQLIIVSLGANSLVVLYFATEAFFAKSPAKFIFGLVIKDISGQTATAWQLIKRWLLKVSSFILIIIALMPGLGFFSFIIILLVVLLGIVVLVGNLLVVLPSSQALHDIFGQTAVFYEKRRSFDEHDQIPPGAFVPHHIKMGGDAQTKTDGPDPKDLFKPRW